MLSIANLCKAGKSSVHSKPRRTTGGFTLIELLVVVAVITVLMAILLPSLMKARAYAKQAACLSNLRQLGTAMLANAQEHQNYVQISGYIASPGGATPSGLNDPSMIRYSYYMDAGQWRPLPLAGAFAPQLGQNIRTDSAANVGTDINIGLLYKIFACPADMDRKQGFTAKATGWSTPKSWSSYGFNEAFLGWRDDGNGISGYSEARGLLTQLNSPSETMFLCDSTPRNGNGGWLDFYATYRASTLAQAYYNNNGAGEKSMFAQDRHMGRMNIVFADGHGEMQNMPQVNSIYNPKGPLSNVYLVAP